MSMNLKTVCLFLILYKAVNKYYIKRTHLRTYFLNRAKQRTKLRLNA